MKLPNAPWQRSHLLFGLVGNARDIQNISVSGLAR